MLNRLTPTPVPTITETVLVTPPPPVINVQIPPDTFDFWQDVVLTGDFVGAVFGVFGALFAAWLVIRADRGTRNEELRRNLALDYANAARQLSKQLQLPPLEAFGKPLEEILEAFELITGRIVRRYSRRSPLSRPARWIMARFRRHAGHSDFGIWIMLHGSTIGVRLEPIKWASRSVRDLATRINSSNDSSIEEREKLANKARQVREQLSEISTDLRVIEHTALEWMNAPRTWRPDRSTREAHERVKELMSNSSVTSQAEPTSPVSPADDGSRTP